MKYKKITIVFLTVYSVIVIPSFAAIVGNMTVGLKYENIYYMAAHYAILILAIYPAWIVFEKVSRLAIRFVKKRGGHLGAGQGGWLALFAGTYWLSASVMSSYIETTCGDIEMLNCGMILVTIPIPILLLVNMKHE